MRAARCLGVRTRRRDRKSARNAWILALRKSRLVVETDLAGRKKRGGKCAGRGTAGVGHMFAGKEKKWGPGVSAPSTLRAPYARRRRRWATRSPFSLFSFSPLSFSPSFPFFLPFFLSLYTLNANKPRE